MRGLAALAVALGVGACAASTTTTLTPSDDSLARYEEDAAFRRSTLEASLVTRDNAYARLRLAMYDEEHWGALPTFSPQTTPLTLEPAPGAGARWTSFDTGSDTSPPETLEALGERAFYNYPVQLAATLPRAVAAADHAGMWIHEGRTGAVWAKLPSGRVEAAYTCATCHASQVEGRLVPGRNNADLDVGRLAGDGERGPSWPRGTVDVTGDGAEDPVAITDLRPVRYQTHLHHAATLRNDPAALAVRIETLIITSLNQSVRPPRRVVAALTAYLLSLGNGSTPASTSPPSTDARGRELFARECAGCHHGPEAAGAPLLLDQVGTDPVIGQSLDRGTGMYRIPSLRFVGDRRRLFASGAVEDIRDLLTPSPGRDAKGHTYGLGLSDADRAALLAHLRGL